jgi:hypothetical protein
MDTNDPTEINLESVDKLLVFSFDLIARITPGIAFLFICFQTSIKDTASTSLADGIAILIVAYLIGITADTAVNSVETIVRKSPMGKIIGDKLSPMGNIIDLGKSFPQAEQIRLTKLLAEAVLLRSCVILCLPLFMFKAPLILKFTEKYINDCMMYYYVCVAALIFVFVVCHIERRIELRKEETKIQSKAKKEAHFGAPSRPMARRSAPISDARLTRHATSHTGS